MAKHIYNICGKDLIWENDDDLSKCPYNNLYIKDFWNMKDVMGHDDVCTDLKIVSEDTFSFFSFNGFRVKMQIKGDEIKCLDIRFAK